MDCSPSEPSIRRVTALPHAGQYQPASSCGRESLGNCVTEYS